MVGLHFMARRTCPEPFSVEDEPGKVCPEPDYIWKMDFPIPLSMTPACQADPRPLPALLEVPGHSLDWTWP